MTDLPADKFNEMVQRVQGGEIVTSTTRELLSMFGAFRRSWRNVSKVRKALSASGVSTDPDFEGAYIDASLQITRVVTPVSYSGKGDPTYRVGALSAANSPPVRVTLDTTVNEALTVMLMRDFSRLPVMNNERDIRGVFSHKGLTSAQMAGKNPTAVRECMEHAQVVMWDASIYEVASLIRQNEYVLVRDRTNIISGMVTASDIAGEFFQLSEPFLLLDEIENHIRNLLDGKFPVETLVAARSPNDPDREITDIADLTFGEYIRLLEIQTNWDRIQLKVDKTTYLRDLTFVRDIRNDVMHFDPDPMDSEELETLRRFVRFMRDLSPIVA